MKKSPFKFLDSYTKADAAIFFGREHEIEEIFSRLFSDNILLLYGSSGTGKTSIIQCGLSNRFNENDWKPFFIRRKENIIESIHNELDKQSLSAFKSTFSIEEKLYSIYLDYLTPIYLIFDQFEEILIFGNEVEKSEFVSVLKSIITEKELNTRVILSIREEYLANLSEFEDIIPELFNNRIRIEKMKRRQAIRVIESPCEVCNVKLEKNVSESILDLITDDAGNIELTWLQVLMDIPYNMALARGENVEILLKDVEALGQIGDVLGSFLDEQLKLMDRGNDGEAILKTLITSEGTKRLLNIEEIQESLELTGNKLHPDQIREILQQFINLRILCEQDENHRYELKHDSLAKKVFERLTLYEKELLEVFHFIEYSYKNFHSRKKYLSTDDLVYIQPYINKLILNKDLTSFVKDSKKELNRKRKRKGIILLGGIALLLLIMATFTIWALYERSRAIKQKNIAENQTRIAKYQKTKIEESNTQLEKAKHEVLNAKLIVESELYNNIKNSLSVSPLKMNVIYKELANPISISSSGISNDKLFPYVNGYLSGKNIDSTLNVKGVAKITKTGNSFLVYNIDPRVNQLNIGATGITNKGDTLDLGHKIFRVQNFPGPFVSIYGRKGGEISKEELLSSVKLDISYYTVFKVAFIIKGFSLTIRKISGESFSKYSNNEYFTNGQKDLILKSTPGDILVIDKIAIIGPKEFGALEDLNLTFIIDGEKFEIEKEKRNKVNNYIALAQKEKSPKMCYRILKAAYSIDTENMIVHGEIVKTFLKIQDEYFDSINSSITNINYLNKYGTLAVNTPQIKYGSETGGDVLKSGIYNYSINKLQPIYTTNNQVVASTYLSKSYQFAMLLKEQGKLIVVNSRGSIVDSVLPLNRQVNHAFFSPDENIIVFTAAVSGTVKEGIHDNRAIVYNRTTGIQHFLWGKYHQKSDLEESLYDVASGICFDIENKYIYATFAATNTLEKWDLNGNFIKSIVLKGSPEQITMNPGQRILVKINGSNNKNMLSSYDSSLDSYYIVSSPDGYDNFNFSNDGRYIVYTNTTTSLVYDQLKEADTEIEDRLPIWGHYIWVDGDWLTIVSDYGQFKYPLKNIDKNIFKTIETDKIFGRLPELTNELNQIIDIKQGQK